MRNKSVSDFVAASMDAVLKSATHQSMFNNTYKFASQQCEKCHKTMEECSCDSNSADDNDVKKNSDSSSDSSSSDSSSAFDGILDTNDVSDKEEDCTEEMESSALDVAIDSLLTASAALDRAGLERGSSLSLKLASLVVEAKKKEDSKKKDSKKSNSDSKKKSDSNDARAKKKKEEDMKKKKEEAAKAKKLKDSNDARAKKKKEEDSKKSSSRSSSSSSSSSSSKRPNPFLKKNKYSFDKISRAADYLNSAASIFDQAGMKKEAAEITEVLSDLAKQISSK